MDKKCALICNPNSGNNDKSVLVKEFTKILAKKGYETIVFYTRYSSHAKKIVSGLQHMDLVVSLGGDGTFNEVVSGNLKRKDQLLLAHIPLGTTNDIGAVFGMGKDPLKNLKMVLDGVVKKLDICTLNDHPFVYVAGLGKFVDIAYDTPRKMKKKLGYFAYLINAVKSFYQKTKLFEVTYEVNGEVYRGYYSFMLICNASRMGGIEVFQDVKMDDGKFEVLFSNISTKKDIIKSLLLLKTTDISKASGFYYYKTDRINIKLSKKPIKHWCLDGEELSSNKLSYEIKVNKGINMLIPSKEVNKIFEK
ncbi:MAG: YegS/Rv2252/BmrU family lipid kinase [Bacilli bacterium]|nr:YegS/Rv2252/BmrU family lipid kinase [Bacilli bacterium]